MVDLWSEVKGRQRKEFKSRGLYWFIRRKLLASWERKRWKESKWPGNWHSFQSPSRTSQGGREEGRWGMEKIDGGTRWETAWGGGSQHFGLWGQALGQCQLNKIHTNKPTFAHTHTHTFTTICAHVPSKLTQKHAQWSLCAATLVVWDW